MNVDCAVQYSFHVFYDTKIVQIDQETRNARVIVENNVAPFFRTRCSYIKLHVMTMLLISTTWRRNAMNIDILELMTSPHPMCRWYFR